MMTKNEYLIAQVKLHELRQQRSRLSRTYEELEQRVASMPAEQQLQALFTGLQQITMAEIALHPDVANLEPLFNGPQLSEETLSFWRERLAKELPQGRLRSELIYIFGALLEEWVQEKSQETTTDPEGIQRSTQLLELASSPADPIADFALLDSLFAERGAEKKKLAQWFQEFTNTILQDRITASELKKVLEALSLSPNHTETIRRQAKSFLNDEVMSKEMAEALSLVLARLDEWDWPEEGVGTFPLWTMNKWRLFFTYDLFTMCFLEVLGLRLQDAFQSFQTNERAEHAERLRTLLKEARHENQRSSLQPFVQLARLADGDIWANLRSQKDIPLTFENVKSIYKKETYGSIIRNRQNLRDELQSASTMLSGYEADQAVDGMRTTLQFINAEIQLAHTAFPQAPFYVLKLDIKDFYPSLSHDLLLTILERYGFSARQLAFFRKFLQIHVRKGEEQTRLLRGVPLHHRFSNVLGEMVLNLLDQHLLRNAQVQIIRLVDDICILTPSTEEATKAWRAAQEFCQSVGLTINQEKCGAVAINGTLPKQLPASLPKWLLVQLNQDGTWEIDKQAFTNYQKQTRQHVLQCSSLLSQIEVYNLHVKHLIRAIAMESDLGKAHRLSTKIAATQFHTAFFYEGHGMVEALRQEIQRRFLDNNSALTLPEAWFYWPITAGGCGLTHVMILASGYAENHSALKERVVPTKRPSNWQYEYCDWQHFYYSFICHIHLKEPVATNRMEMLVKDFIQRSNEMGNSRQTTLGPYWRWILYIYGPQILDHLGTFRFLSTELVPLQIILQHYQHAQSAEDSDTFTGDDDIPF